MVSFAKFLAKTMQTAQRPQERLKRSINVNLTNKQKNLLALKKCNSFNFSLLCQLNSIRCTINAISL